MARAPRFRASRRHTRSPPGNGQLIAGMTDGRILHSTDAGGNWEDAGLSVGSVVAMAVAG
jgi:hypothetical protein